MALITERKNLKPLNTFGIEVYCDYFIEINSTADFVELVKNDVYRSNKKLVIGGGSNILFTEDFKGIVLKNNIKGKEIVDENAEDVLVKIGAGENWHGFVLWCISNNFCGLENLSLIPGCVGASPMQNIGAYGVEIKEVFEELEAYSMRDASRRIFRKEECHFGYRESVFKREYRDEYFITSVTYRLKKKAEVNVSYGAISAELESAGIKQPGIKDVSDAVIRIRQSKLPDPAVTGNAGSFFKNPEVREEQYNSLKAKYPALVAYPLAGGNYKLAAGWLIEQCGLKGYEYKGAAVHSKQALVLVNKGNCRGEDVLELSSHVMKVVFDKFGVMLEREVNII